MEAREERKRKTQRKYTLFDKEQAIALYQKGLAVNQISKQLKINVKQVWMWTEIYKIHGEKGLKKKKYTLTTTKFKQQVVSEIIQNCLPLNRAAIKHRLSISTVRRWVTTVKENGYDALCPVKKPLQTPIMARPKKREPQTELEIAQEEIKRLKAENALLKKVKALVEARDAQLRKIGQEPSKI